MEKLKIVMMKRMDGNNIFKIYNQNEKIPAKRYLVTDFKTRAEATKFARKYMQTH